MPDSAFLTLWRKVDSCMGGKKSGMRRGQGRSYEMNAKKAKRREGRMGSEKDDPSLADSYRLAQQVGGAR